MDKKRVEMAVVMGVSKVFNYLKHNPYATEEEVMANVVKELDVSSKLKRVAVGGISRAFKYLQQGMKEKEIMQRVLNEVDEIVKGIEESERPVQKARESGEEEKEDEEI
jgi:hypothetical protein